MTDKQRTSLSKFLSLVLHHQPQEIGITLDEAGWVLRIRAGDMHRAGISFFRSANDVWLTHALPPVYIDFPG